MRGISMKTFPNHNCNSNQNLLMGALHYLKFVCKEILYYLFHFSLLVFQFFPPGNIKISTVCKILLILFSLSFFPASVHCSANLTRSHRSLNMSGFASSPQLYQDNIVNKHGENVDCDERGLTSKPNFTLLGQYQSPFPPR